MVDIDHTSGMGKVILDKIENLRVRDGLDIYEVESLAGLPPKRLWRWGQGQGEPSARQALRLARLFRVPVEWLVDDEQGGDPPQGQPAEPGLSYEDRVVLDVVHAMNLDHLTAVRRLAPDEGREPTPLPPGANPGKPGSAPASGSRHEPRRSSS